jgi:phenylacetate-coenzyme A ligase PaaK-like adenylate-forming protein
MMTTIPITPLEDWIAEKIGLPGAVPLTQAALARYQTRALNATVTHAFRRSPFYQARMGGDTPPVIERLEDIHRLPFTTAEDLRCDPHRFLCVSQGAVARVVTLQTSGTTRSPKRVFFTQGDLEETIDFFQVGMSTLVAPGERVLILMPGDTHGSVGHLLAEALSRMDVKGVVHGPMKDPASTAAAILEEKITCLVGLPAQLNALARSAAAAMIPPGQLTSVLLAADYVPQAVIANMKNSWQCEVFQHYGMTESGYGGGVDCAGHGGYHLREADLYYEIVDPGSGRPLADGAVGEVVFTTLTRNAMPLIRYRTGDLAAFVTAACPCGSSLRRMGPVSGRIEAGIHLGQGSVLALTELDEAIFAVDGVLDFRVTLRQGRKCPRLGIHVTAARPESREMAPATATAASTAAATAAANAAAAAIEAAVRSIPAIAAAIAAERLALDEIEFGPLEAPDSSAIKRRIIDRREEAVP